MPLSQSLGSPTALLKGKTVAYELSLPPLFSLTAERGTELVTGWHNFLQNLPLQTSIHKQDWYTYDSSPAASNVSESFLASAHQRHLDCKPYLRQCSILFITLPFARIDSFMAESILKKAVTFLEAVNIIIAPLRDDALLNKLMYQFIPLLNKPANVSLITNLRTEHRLTEQIRLPDLKQLTGTTESGLIAHPDLSNQAISYDLSPVWVGQQAFMNELLPVNHVYNQYIHIPYFDQINRILEAADTFYSFQSLFPFRLLAKESVEHRNLVKSFKYELAGSHSMPIHMHVNLMAWPQASETKEEMDSKVSKHLAKGGYSTFNHYAEADKLILLSAANPTGNHQIPLRETILVPSQFGCKLLNSESLPECPVEENGVWLSERVTGRPVCINLSDYSKSKLQNLNKMILGPAGSGRSFLLQHLLLSYYERKEIKYTHALKGTAVWVFALGDTYENLCNYVGGKKVDITETVAFNPFEWLLPGRAAEMSTLHQQRFLVEFIGKLWKSTSIEHDPHLLLGSVINAYSEALGQGTMLAGLNSFYEFIQALLHTPTVGQVGIDPILLLNLLEALSPFYKGGAYEKLLNASASFSLMESSFTLVCLDKLSDHIFLMPLVMDLLLNCCHHCLEAPHSNDTIILFDETWQMVSSTATNYAWINLMIIARASGGEIWVATADIDHFIHGYPRYDDLVWQFDTKLFLDTRKYHGRLGQIDKAFHLALPTQALALLGSLNRDIDRSGSGDSYASYREVFIATGSDHSAIYRVDVSAEQYLLFCSDRLIKNKLLKMVDEHSGNYRAAIQAILADESTKKAL